MITKIILRNFKRFKEETFELESEVDPHVIFAGNNNLGKTTVIQAVMAWSFALNKWNNSNKKRSIRLSRSEFFSVPLREFNQLWTGKSTGMKKGEVTGVAQGTPRSLGVEIHGKNKGKKWHLNMEFKYANNDLIYAKPKDVENIPIPEADINLETIYIPSFSGIMTNEPERNRALQDVLIGQGKPGDILRNLLLEVSEKGEAWQDMCTHIKDVFNYELAKPSARGQAYILCECRSLNSQGKPEGPLLDINTTGSGFQQFLLIIAFLYARQSSVSQSSVILLDEPDAHLHINLQSVMYSTLKNIAKDKKGQLIIATHSEVLINSTAPQNIISFFGQHPRTLSKATEQKKLQKAMGRLSTIEILKAEQSVDKVLYLEGHTDLDILRAWAETLDHSALKWFNDINFYWHNMGGKRPKEALEYFQALQAISPTMRGFVLIDSDGKPNETLGFDFNVKAITMEKWRRYEIESYLVHPATLERFLKSHEHRDKAIKKMRGIIPSEYLEDSIEDSIGYFRYMKGSNILQLIFKEANYHINKDEYHLIAQEMKSEEIHPDVSKMLDAIAEHLEIKND